MKNLSGKVAVVTGAASGIGRALAGALADEGCRLALADIDADGLQNTANLVDRRAHSISTHRLDVSDREAVFQYASDVITAEGRVDIVINNAGVTALQSIEDVGFDDFEWVMAVNFWGVVYGTKAFLPHLKTRPWASIVNISSINAYIPFPLNGPYSCSKYAVCGLNETLHQELADTAVTVLSVHPGGIDTNIVRNARFGEIPDPSGGRLSHEQVIENFARATRTSPEKAAATIVRAIKKRKRRVLVGPDAHVIEKAKRLAPEASVQAVARLMRWLF